MGRTAHRGNFLKALEFNEFQGLFYACSMIASSALFSAGKIFTAF